MIFAGIDIGSRSIEVVTIEGGVICQSLSLPTTYSPMEQVRSILSTVKFDRITATGYGRKIAAKYLKSTAITEIQAHALGARFTFPQCRAVLDIGGQDTKVIALNENGSVMKFEMNDRCAAGTGKFLEFMATSFQKQIDEFGDYALGGNTGTVINSMCTVFAETEATSLMAQGLDPKDIAYALHESVVKRSLSMLRRVSTEGSTVFSGGVGRNNCILSILKESDKREFLVYHEPEFIGAIGAAVYCSRKE